MGSRLIWTNPTYKSHTKLRDAALREDFDG
jgi:hypothetical protein